MQPSNELLAKVFYPTIHQMVIIWPIVWKHMPNGNWFVAKILDEN